MKVFTLRIVFLKPDIDKYISPWAISVNSSLKFGTFKFLKEASGWRRSKLFIVSRAD